MRRARFLEQEQRQEGERSIKYRGTASIKLDVLHFPCEESREPDKKNVKRLRNLFREEGGCLDLRNHIPAVIDYIARSVGSDLRHFKTGLRHFKSSDSTKIKSHMH
jgi:hypothetical protein